MSNWKFDIERLTAVLEEPKTTVDAFNEAVRRIKVLLSMSE